MSKFKVGDYLSNQIKTTYLIVDITKGGEYQMQLVQTYNGTKFDHVYTNAVDFIDLYYKIDHEWTIKQQIKEFLDG